MAFSKPLVVSALLVCLAGVAAGQSGQGYLSLGVGSGPGGALTEPAAGGEFIVAQTVGIGGDLGAVLRHSSFGFVSLDGSFHLARNAATGKIDPFIVGGYSRAFDIFSGLNGGNFGFGVNFWFTDHYGLHAEFRDLVVSSSNYWAVCFGIGLR